MSHKDATYRPGVQVNCTNRSRVPVTRRVRVQAGRVMVLAYLPQSASVDVCKHEIGDRNELVEVLRRQPVCVEYMLGCYQHDLVFHALARG